ncbi:MAG: ornithine cyclodeaminase family protein [Chloroflexi bacterium]|nr:ornithine cyclodeaminase family protein [Chloroflexota bacterium]
MTAAIESVESALRDVARGTAQVRPRQRVRIPSAILQVMPAGHPQLGLGFKAYASTSSGTHFYFFLFDPASGQPLALFQANLLGQIRTGAATGVATKYLARPDAGTVGIIGSGFQAYAQLEAIAAVRPITHARCYSRSAERRVQFAASMSDRLGISVTPVASAQSAVQQADIIVTITTASNPVVQGEWIQPGTHVNAAGSNQAAKSEIDPTTVARASIVAVDLLEQARSECGDLLAAEAAGSFSWDRACELGDIISGKTSGRRDAHEVTLFESQGIAIEDVAVGHLVYTRAREQHVGIDLDI